MCVCVCLCVCVCVREEHLQSNPWMYPTQTASRGNREGAADLLMDEDYIGRDAADYLTLFKQLVKHIVVYKQTKL